MIENELKNSGFRFDGANDPVLSAMSTPAGPVGGIVNSAIERYYTNEIQMSTAQIEIVAAAICSRGPNCNLLVFGLGNDSPLWAEINAEGHTLFVEDALDWIAKVKTKHEHLNVEHIKYPTSVSKSLSDPVSTIQAAAHIPAVLTERHWDVIIVDGPMGWGAQYPGRAFPIAWASQIGSNSTHVFVDDYERDLESKYADLIFGTRRKTRSVVVNRPATPRLNASSMLWLIGESDGLKTGG